VGLSIRGLIVVGAGLVAIALTAVAGWGVLNDATEFDFDQCTDQHVGWAGEMSRDAALIALANRFETALDQAPYCESDDAVAGVRAVYRSPLTWEQVKPEVVGLVEESGWQQVERRNCFMKEIDRHRVAMKINSGAAELPRANIALSIYGVLEHPTSCSSWH
jgi:hypothetical protein